jgi:hypothetical protein
MGTNVDFISGGYQISPQSEETFIFWWANPVDKGKNFFDVSIAPQFDGTNTTMMPLEEKTRTWLYTVEEGAVHPVQWKLALTLHNPNDFAVNFLANHVMVYNSD